MIELLKRVPKRYIIFSIFFACLQGITELILPTLTASLVNDGIAKGDMAVLTQIAIRMGVLTLIIVGSALTNIWYSSLASQGLGRDLRNALYRKTQRLSKDVYDQFGSASLITRTSSDIMQIELTTQMVLRMFLLSPAMLIASVFMAYRASIQMSQTYLATIPLIFISLAIVIHTASPLFRSMQSKVDRMNLVFREGLTGVRVIRAFNKEDYESDRFRQANEDYRQTAIGAQFRLAFLMPALMTILNLTTVFLNWYGGHLVAIRSIDLGVILSFISYTSIMGVSFMFIGFMFVLIPRAQVSAERINDVLQAPETIHSPADGGRVIDDATPLTLSVSEMGFAYEGAQANVLTGIHFDLAPGQTLGIIGATGSGKSTIANLILRYYDVTAGHIRFNGQDVRDYQLDNLRDHIGYVPQRANLFSGTIRSNLAFGNSEASDEAMWQALEIAQAADFVRALPDQLDAVVEQGGANFSGGQKQRLCIARAIMKQAPLMIFDDSFSALDASTDVNLRRALHQSMADSMMIIIAQRVSTILDADQILVLNDDGSVAGLGSHEELMASTPLYAAIVSSQAKEVVE